MCNMQSCLHVPSNVIPGPILKSRLHTSFDRAWRAGSAGDVENARLALQNALADEAAQSRPDLWRFFQAFEVQHGSIQEVLQVEAGWATALAPAAPLGRRALAALDRLRRRYTHFDLWPCTLAQRAHLESLLAPNAPVAAATPYAPAAAFYIA
jgi:hypothetical protein